MKGGAGGEAPCAAAFFGGGQASRLAHDRTLDALPQRPTRFRPGMTRLAGTRTAPRAGRQRARQPARGPRRLSTGGSGRFRQPSAGAVNEDEIRPTSLDLLPVGVTSKQILETRDHHENLVDIG